MNNKAKRLCRHLEALNFHRDYDAEEKVKAGSRVYWHANEPETPIKVGQCVNDFTITTLTKLANRIVGLASNGPDAPKLKERVKSERRKKNAQQQREAAAVAERAEKAEAAYQIKQKVSAKIAERREFEQLMRHGYGR